MTRLISKYVYVRNHLRIVFEEKSSWTPLTMYVSRDGDNILDKIYIKQICSDFYYEDLKI